MLIQRRSKVLFSAYKRWNFSWNLSENKEVVALSILKSARISVSVVITGYEHDVSLTEIASRQSTLRWWWKETSCLFYDTKKMGQLPQEYVYLLYGLRGIANDQVFLHYLWRQYTTPVPKWGLPPCGTSPTTAEAAIYLLCSWSLWYRDSGTTCLDLSRNVYLRQSINIILQDLFVMFAI